MPTSDAAAKDANRRRGAIGWVVLGIAAVIDVGVVVAGSVGWAAGAFTLKIEPALIAIYGTGGAISVLALIYRWRKWSKAMECLLATLAVIWAGLVGLAVLMLVFGWMG
jgi:hypothetical protein